MRNLLIIIVQFQVLLSVVGLDVVYAQEDEGIVLDKKDIIIYQLSSQQGKNHFKAIYFVDINDGDFVKMLLNPENHKLWLSNIKKAENISEENDSLIYTRIVISVNTIFKKEAIVRTSVEHNAKSDITHIIQEVDHSSEHEPKYKSFNDFKADWEIRKITENRIEVKLSFLGVKDKNYPRFISNFLESLFIKKLFKLAYKTRDQANKKEY